jgi:CHASE2 domain-containing sensor protein
MALVAACVSAWVLVSESGLLSGFEQETMRWRYQMRGELASASQVVFVDLDQATISMMGDRPWNRWRFGEAIHTLLEYGGARTVGLDVILSKFGSSALLDVELARAGDARMGELVGDYGDRIVLAGAYTGTYSSIADDVFGIAINSKGRESTRSISVSRGAVLSDSGLGAGAYRFS